VVRSGHGFFSFTIVSPFLFGNFSGWNVVMVSRLKTKRRPLEPLEESTEIRGYARKDGQTRLGMPRTVPSSV
jgi:hypothetical protein